MAYSNWGGKVWCDGIARHDLCDVSMRDVLGLGEDGIDVWTDDDLGIIRHAVVGDAKAGFIFGLYKSGPWYGQYEVCDGKPVKIETPMDGDGFDWYDSLGFVLDLNGTVVKFEHIEDPAQVWCEFRDKIGRNWKAVSGYSMGEGFERWK